VTDESEELLQLQRTPETDRETVMKLEDACAPDDDFWAFADTWKRIDAPELRTRGEVKLTVTQAVPQIDPRLFTRTPPRLNIPPRATSELGLSELTPLPRPWRGDIALWAAVFTSAVLFYLILRAF
jgi:hypothetical protein